MDDGSDVSLRRGTLAAHLEDLEWYHRKRVTPQTAAWFEDGIPSLSRRGRISVDTSAVTGVPCIICSPKAAKVVLKGLRVSNMQTFKNSTRQLLSPHQPRESKRAFQVSDAAATLIETAMSTGAAGRVVCSEEECKILDWIEDGTVSYEAFFPLHYYIIEERAHDETHLTHTQEYIQFLPCHSAASEGRGIPSQGPSRNNKKIGGEFTFCELFAGIGGFKVPSPLTLTLIGDFKVPSPQP